MKQGEYDKFDDETAVLAHHTMILFLFDFLLAIFFWIYNFQFLCPVRLVLRRSRLLAKIRSFWFR